MQRALRDAVATAIVEALERQDNVRALGELAEMLALSPGSADTAPSAERSNMGDLLRPELDEDRRAAAERAFRALRVVERYWREQADLHRTDALERALVQAALLFNAGLFFEVHEILEAVWRTLEGEHRHFVQGLIQIAVAFYHLEAGNKAGARTLFAEGRAKIGPHAPEHLGVDLGELLAGLGPWEEAADGGTEPDVSDMPVFRVRRGGRTP